MKKKKFLITGGTGFIGSALVKALITKGNVIRVFDNNSRGKEDRISKISEKIEFIHGDVRNKIIVEKACQNIDCVVHLASINGTEFFYTKPDVVLDVSVSGMINLLKACIKHNVPEFFLASSSEVYNNPPIIPTPENVPLLIPDVYNPRFSYSGGKIISELLAIHYGKKYFKRIVVFRLHNIYGPDMGKEHVIPQFVLQMMKLIHKETSLVPFKIQGSGKEKRAYLYIDDAISALTLLIGKGKHLEIYNIGSNEEIASEKIAILIGNYFNRKIVLEKGKLLDGSVKRRCADITKISKLGFIPKINFIEGLPKVIKWYVQHEK